MHGIHKKKVRKLRKSTNRSAFDGWEDSRRLEGRWDTLKIDERLNGITCKKKKKVAECVLI